MNADAVQQELLVWLAWCLQVGMTHTGYQDRNNEYGRMEHLGSSCCQRCQAAMILCHQTYITSRNSCLQITCHSLLNAETAMSLYKILVNIIFAENVILCCHITLSFELYSYFDHNLAVMVTSTAHIPGT